MADTPPPDDNPVAQIMQPNNDVNQDAKISAMKPPSPFVNSEPVREEQVQNAIKFLSHPKVRGSPVMYRRSFLERKGLTKEEIDEAFRRVPDPTPDVSAAQPNVTNQDAKSALNVPSQPPTQAVQLTSVGQVPGTLKTGMLYRFHWSHALIAIGFLTASGCGTVVLFKKSIIPRLKSWIRKVVFEEEEVGLLTGKNRKPSVAEEAAAAAKSAAAAAADVAQASQTMLITRGEEKRMFEELIGLVNAQVHEMKSMHSAIKKLDAGESMKGRVAVEERDYQRVSVTNSRQPYANGKTDTVTDYRSVRSLSPPVPAEPSVAPHPKSYMEIMSMIQRGEKPSNIREINDAPPNPNHPISNPRIAPRPKPWEVNQTQYSSNITTTQERNNGINYEYQDNQSNGGDAASFWQPKNVRISEMESTNEQKFGSSSAVVSNERPAQRSWVPPQPPPVVMAEAAAAIRQPKKPSYQQEQQMTDDQLLARDPSSSDELQRITKISELGGNVEANGEGSGVYSTEVQVEENGSYVEA